MSHPPVLPAWPVVNDLLTLPLAQRLELGQTLWDSIAAEQSGPELTGADRSLQCLQPAELAGAREARVSQALQDPHELQPRW
jgi:hypothetical protein